MLGPVKSDAQREKRAKVKMWDGKEWERRRGEKAGGQAWGRE